MKNTRNIILKIKDKNQESFNLMCSIYNDVGNHIQDISYTLRKNNLQEDFNNVLKSLTSIKVFNFNFKTEDKKILELLEIYNGKEEPKIVENVKNNSVIVNDKIKYPTNDNEIYMYVGLETDIDTKTTEFKILAYNSDQERVIKKEMYENRKNDNHLFLNELKVKIIELQESGKIVKLYGKGLLFSLFNQLNKTFEEEGRNQIELRDGTGILNEKAAHRRIKKHMSDFYDSLNQLNDKYVYFLDGSVSESGQKYASAFLCRNTNELISKQTKVIDGMSSGHKVNESEVIALKSAIDYMVLNRQNDKPIYLIFDSDNIASKLKKGLNGEFPDRITNVDLIMQEICEKIKNNNLKINVNVVKSHSENYVHDIFKYNKIVDEFARESLNKGSQIRNLSQKK